MHWRKKLAIQFLLATYATPLVCFVCSFSILFNTIHSLKLHLKLILYSLFLLKAENLPCLHSLRRFSPLGISASVDTLDPPTGSCTTLTSIVCHLKCPLCHSSEGCIFVEGAVFE